MQPSNIGVFRYEYDGNARLKKVIPPAGLPGTEYEYDFLGRERERKRVGPSERASTWTTSWSNGSPTVTNQLGEKVERTLDGRGRVVSEVYSPRPPPSPTAPVYKDLETAEYVFNGLDQLRFAFEQRTVGGQNKQTRNAFTYDAFDQLEVWDRDGEEVRYAYWPSGARRSITSPAGVVGYELDALQRLSKVTLADSSVLNVAWEVGGERLASIGNGFSWQSSCYDNRGRVLSVTHDAAVENCASPSASPRLRHTYTYDDSDNRVSEVVRRAGSTVDEVTSYGYDEADRLTGVRYPDNQSFLYRLAADGTRKGERHVLGYSGVLDGHGFESSSSAQKLKDLTYEHDSLGGLRQVRDAVTGNQVVAQFQTDVLGRMTSESRADLSRTMHFDAAGRLVEAEVTEGSQQRRVKYQYDFAGLRRTSDAEGFVTKYVWSGEAELLEEQLPGAGSLLYQRAAGVVVAVGRERMLGDVFGSPVGRMSPGGEVTRTDFGAHGEYRGGVKPTSTMASLGYTGHSFDANLGLIYAQQRWYSPELGRFLSEDPVGAGAYLAAPQGLNPWLYANGSPTRYTDPDGRFGVPGAIIGGIVGGLGGCLYGALASDVEGGCLAYGLVGATAGAVGGATFGFGLAAVGLTPAAAVLTPGTLLTATGAKVAVIGSAAGATSGFASGFITSEDGSLSGRTINGGKAAVHGGVLGLVAAPLMSVAVSYGVLAATGTAVALDSADQGISLAAGWQDKWDWARTTSVGLTSFVTTGAFKMYGARQARRLGAEPELGGPPQRLKSAPGALGAGDDFLEYAHARNLIGQETDSGCAVACVRMRLADLGRSPHQNEAAAVRALNMRGGGSGNPISEIPGKIARAAGVRARYGLMTLEELAAATSEQPAIVSVKLPNAPPHAIVVDQIKRGYVMIRDPISRDSRTGQPIANGRASGYRMTIDDFRRLFVRDGNGRGKVVVFEPKSEGAR